jgi:hypothetical protein
MSALRLVQTLMTVVRAQGGLVACGLALGALLLAGCGESSHKLLVSVVSSDGDPVLEAHVNVDATRLSGATGNDGVAHLAGLRPGVYTVVASAPGYFSAIRTLRVVSGSGTKKIVLRLGYRPPVGTFVWNIGPDGMYWDQGTVTKSSMTATEFDWTCARDSRTGKTVGSWTKLPGALPYATAPDTIASEWVRGHFPPSGPPRPAKGCREARHAPTHAHQTPFS